MTAVVSRLDPLRAAPRGRYEDDLVFVVLAGPPGLTATRLADGRVLVQHCLPHVDDDLAERLATALGPLTDDHEVFARAFVGVVLTGHHDPGTAWERFYRASLRRRDGFAAVHAHAARLLRGHDSVLDLGCSFGLLALRLAGAGHRVRACEADPGTAALVTAMSRRLGRPLDVHAGSAALPDGCVDAVALIHVLEHVDPGTGHELVAEAVRIARRRVVVAVPYEHVPTTLYGHVRLLDERTLADLGTRTAWATTVHEHHGGWLVLDRP